MTYSFFHFAVKFIYVCCSFFHFLYAQRVHTKIYIKYKYYKLVDGCRWGWGCVQYVLSSKYSITAIYNQNPGIFLKCGKWWFCGDFRNFHLFSDWEAEMIQLTHNTFFLSIMLIMMYYWLVSMVSLGVIRPQRWRNSSFFIKYYPCTHKF